MIASIEELGAKHFAAWAEARKAGKTHEEAIRAADAAIAADADKRDRARERALERADRWI
jgi:hypothetical protein